MSGFGFGFGARLELDVPVGPPKERGKRGGVWAKDADVDIGDAGFWC